MIVSEPRIEQKVINKLTDLLQRGKYSIKEVNRYSPFTMGCCRTETEALVVLCFDNIEVEIKLKETR
jgi:hypothetical protein